MCRDMSVANISLDVIIAGREALERKIASGGYADEDVASAKEKLAELDRYIASRSRSDELRPYCDVMAEAYLD